MQSAVMFWTIHHVVVHFFMCSLRELCKNHFQPSTSLYFTEWNSEIIDLLRQIFVVTLILYGMVIIRKIFSSVCRRIFEPVVSAVWIRNVCVNWVSPWHGQWCDSDKGLRQISGVERERSKISDAETAAKPMKWLKKFNMQRYSHLLLRRRRWCIGENFFSHSEVRLFRVSHFRRSVTAESGEWVV